MTAISRLSRLMQRFRACQKGTVAITYALSAIPLLLAAGASIDFVRFMNAQTEIQAALDAAGLAAAVAEDVSDSQRITIGEDAFAANLSNKVFDAGGVTATFTVDNGRVTASAAGTMPTAIMQIAGITSMDLAVTSEISIPEGKKAEIALVLDYSGSMEETSGGQVKYIAMRNAAIDLIDDLSDEEPGKVKFGLVPFSHQVYTSLPKAYVNGQSGSGNWTGCTQDRKFPHNLSDGTPTASNNTKWGQPMAPDHAGWGCSGYAPRNLVVRPLTDDFSALRGQLNSMTPYAWTHIALGVEFGFHLLSPNAPYTEGVAYTDEGTQKYMIVLTDGEQTEPAFGPGSSRTVQQGETNLASLCVSAKANNITIITVAYDLDDADTRARLSDCSTDASKHFFVAEDGGDIAQVFDSIKNEILADVFISK
jgi:Flp pilus assembly protein TadG